jgi:hypothetical protein
MDDAVEQYHQEVEPIELVADLRARPFERALPRPLRRRDQGPVVTALLRPQVTPDDAALPRLDREGVLLEDRDVVVRRPRDQADEDAEAALRPGEQEDVAGRGVGELRPGVLFRRG